MRAWIFDSRCWQLQSSLFNLKWLRGGSWAVHNFNITALNILCSVICVGLKWCGTCFRSALEGWGGGSCSLLSLLIQVFLWYGNYSEERGRSPGLILFFFLSCLFIYSIASYILWNFLRGPNYDNDIFLKDAIGHRSSEWISVDIRSICKRFHSDVNVCCS